MKNDKITRCPRVRRYVWFEGYEDEVCGKRAKDIYDGRCGQCFNKPDPGLIYMGQDIYRREFTPLGEAETAFLENYRAKQRATYEKYKGKYKNADRQIPQLT